MQEEYIWNLIGKKLSGEASDEDLGELEKILRTHPDLHYSIQTVMDFWNPGSVQNPEESEIAFERHINRMKRLNMDLDSKNSGELEIGGNELGVQNKRHKNKQPKLFSVIALAAIGLGFVLFFLKIHDPTEPVQNLNATKIKSEISTRNGSKTNVVLPDGSLVWLNAGSTLSYDKNFGVSIREINLSGEAFFDVVHNAEKPFIIHTSKMDIKVLGTRFNVKSYPTDRTSEATLLRGSIEVSIKDRPSQKIILKPNEKIVIPNAEKSPLQNLPSTNKSHDQGTPIAIRKLTYEPLSGDIVETSWVENKLIFRDQPFKELAAQMERWFGVVIRFADPSKEDLRFTGSFKNETIQQALEALKLTVPFNYSIHDNQIIITDR